MSSAPLSNRNRPRNRPNTNMPNSNRSQYQNSFNSRRETPEPESSSPPGVYADPRTAMVLCSFMGTRTTVKTKNGSTYKGHTTGFSEKGDIALCDVKLDDEDNSLNPTLPGIIIHKERFVVCKTNGVDLKGLCSASSDFIDSAIVNRANGSNADGSLRELQPWQDDDALDINQSLSLDDSKGGWEPTAMFAVNTEKFNVQTSYNEAMPEYTTRLPDPTSEGYEERQRFAQKQAEEIERSEAYQNRIAKELSDGDEEGRYSAVHRGGDSQNIHRSLDSSNSGGKNTYTIPPLRSDSETNTMRNGVTRNQGRTLQRQNSPYNSSSQQQQHSHQHLQNRQPINSHYPPPSAGSLRNQGPPSVHRQQAQNHTSPSHPHQYQQQPPPQHQPMQSHTQLPTQHQRPVPHQQPPIVSPTQHTSAKSQTPIHHHSSSPSNIQSSLQQQPPPSQHQLPQKISPPQAQHNVASNKGAPSVNGPVVPANISRQPMIKQVNGEGQNSIDSTPERVNQADLNSNVIQKTQDPPVSSSANSVVENQQIAPNTIATTSPLTVLPGDRRVGRGIESGPEERQKISRNLQDFQEKFVLGPQDTSRQEDTIDEASLASTQGTSVVSPPVALPPEIVTSIIETTDVSTSSKTAEKMEDEETPVSKSKLNPNAKEFRPKAQSSTPITTPVELQSPSPQPRTTPPQMVQYPMYPVFIPNAAQQRKRATVSLNTAGVPELTAHHVTGQPLLATHTQPHAVMYMAQPGQTLPPGYSFYPQMMPRMLGPNPIAIAQGGQHGGLEQAQQQVQPQPVFMTAQQQGVHAPMPAHLNPHPQPAHGQALPLQSTNQQPQPTHVPNPAPSPVQHQQHSSQQIPQPLPHHMSQGPPQSVTPQPAHYTQMSYIQNMPRTTMSGQPGLTGGHPTVSIGYPMAQYTPYPNGNPAQYPYAPVAQPQTSQNSSHGQGPQPQYVVMPTPSPQGHPPMQQHPQTYPASIQFQPQHNIMQGPPQMPPNHGPNPNQGGHHIIHSGMPGLHQQVSGSQPSMYMQAATLQQFQHQQ
ncbi:unnamed protein product [Lymnaea stagnalis]|uniref:LsmAD domain-containing protein n=1 Tax=Lymnaea stagnalis TaxID=6523 RepID=A0AAV2HDS0_LYMST